MTTANRSLADLGLYPGDLVSAAMELKADSGTATGLRVRVAFFDSGEASLQNFDGNTVSGSVYTRSIVNGIVIPVGAAFVNVGYVYDSVTVGTVTASRRPILNRGPVAAPFVAPPSASTSIHTHSAASITAGVLDAARLPDLSGDYLPASSADTGAVPDTIAKRNNLGDVFARLFRSTYQNQASIGATAGLAFRTEAASDNYIRFVDSPGAVRGWLELSGKTTVSTLTPSGGANGDIWFQVGGATNLAPAEHEHDASDITSGELDEDRLPKSLTGRYVIDHSVNNEAALIVARTVDDASNTPALIVANDGEDSDVIAEFRSNAAGTSVDISDAANSADAKVKIMGDGEVHAKYFTEDGTRISALYAAASHSHSYSDLPFNPIQQGGGAGQGTNKIYIGWNSPGLSLQIDSTDFADNWPIDISGTAANASQLGGQDSTYYRNASNLNAGTVALDRLPWKASAALDPAETGPSHLSTGLYVADLGTVAGASGNPNYTAAIVGSLTGSRQIALTVSDEHIYGKRVHSAAGTYTWFSRVKNADDADLLGGASKNTGAVADTIVQRDSLGDVTGRMLRATIGDDSTMSGAIAYRVNNGTENYLQYCDSPSAVRGWLELSGSTTVSAAAPSGGSNGDLWFQVGGSGNLAPADHEHDASDITSGVFVTARIPNLAASKITSGTFAAARIPDLSGTYATAGHTHSTYDHSATLTGATVFDEIDVTNGIVTNVSTRTLTAANIGAAASSHDHSAANITSGTLSNSRLANASIPDRATELPGSVDLNSYQSAGFYYQTANADAASGSNYPEPLAGSLVVQKSAGVTQQYYTYNDGGPELWFRAFYNSNWSPWLKVHHTGNGGSGSGFDSDKLRGYTPSTSQTANTIALRNGSGDIYARLFRATYQNQTSIASTAALAFRNEAASDNYTRYCSSPSAVRGWLELSGKTTVSTSGPSGGANGDLWFQVGGSGGFNGGNVTNSIGIGTTPGTTLNNGKGIAFGDNDTGIRQNGDGRLEFWANNQEVFDITNAKIDCHKWIEAPYIRITNTTDASGSSSVHGLQIGATTGANTRYDGNEASAWNNGSPAPFYLKGSTVALFYNDTAEKLVTNSGGVTVTGACTATSFNATSARRFKDFQTFDVNAWEMLDQLDPRAWTWREDFDGYRPGTFAGFEAEAVDETEAAFLVTRDDETGDVMGLDYNGFHALHWQNAQTAKRRIEKLEAENAELWRRLEALEKKVK